MISRGWVLFLALLPGVPHAGETVSVHLRQSQEEKLVQSFATDTLSRLKTARIQGFDPAAKRVAEARGPLLSAVLDAAMKDLSAEARAQIDVIVLRGQGGVRAWIPRAWVMRNSIILAGSGGVFRTVVPAGGRAARADELPVETYAISGVERVVLSNFREEFGSFYLNRRTDPAAIRGEKIFVQNCLSCHGAPVRPALAAAGWAEWKSSVAHPAVTGFQKPESRSERALASYWSAFRSERAENR